MRRVAILGTRGIPAVHGGFETFAQEISLFLVERGWQVTVYCQKEGPGEIYEDDWQGIRRVHIPVCSKGAWATLVFDWRSILHVSGHLSGYASGQRSSKDRLVLTLGYNTAIFCLLHRLKGIKNAINMDGVEWQRSKWKWWQRAWLYVNERCGAWIADHLIADHPVIENRLKKIAPPWKITFIPYAADCVTSVSAAPLDRFHLTSNCYALLIARPEPENSILEVVRAYTGKKRHMPLVVLGNFDPDANAYHRQVMDQAGEEVVFPGAIYEKSLVQTLRYHARFYVHGHTVGGTNPSLVEALGAGSPVLAHDNPYNRWVAGPKAAYFSSETECERQISLLTDDDDRVSKMGRASRKRFEERFTGERVYAEYEDLLNKLL